jgi:hypothetical protein
MVALLIKDGEMVKVRSRDQSVVVGDELHRQFGRTLE